MAFQDQLARIKAKLPKAAGADADCKRFGASMHRYQLYSPVEESAISAWEEKYGVALPACYRDFMTCVGNGQDAVVSGAGPCYGLYAFGTNLNQFTDPTVWLRHPPVFHPGMSEEAWDELEEDEEGDVEVYAGILPIGTLGCSSYYGLLLEGPGRGRVVTLNLEGYVPWLAREGNFLDWYERWLDEVIAGYHDYAYGTSMAGDDVHLLSVFNQALDRATREDALRGFQKLPEIQEESARSLRALCDVPETEIKQLALSQLTRLNYPLAEGVLRRMIQERDHLEIATKVICYQGRAHASDWVSLFAEALPSIENLQTFQYIIDIFAHSQAHEEILPFCTHEREAVRRKAFGAFEKLEDKAKLLPAYIRGLQDESPGVVAAAIRTMGGYKDEAVISHFKDVLARFPENTAGVLTHLIYAARGMGQAADEVLTLAAEHPHERTRKVAQSALQALNLKSGK